MSDALTPADWQRHRAAVLAWLRRRTGDPMLAEDLAQEACLRLHRAQADLAQDGQVRAWLLRTAHNLLVDHFRARRPEQRLETATEAVAPEATPWRAFEVCIEPLSQELPELYRSALLWDLDGMPQQEIAQR
ncbi:MAG: sigma-70 family RNA polymerase sigma factor, partial [Gammaproteobacteria bacterium]